MPFGTGPIVLRRRPCSVHGHVACITHSTMAKAEEEAVHWRSIIAMTAASKYQIITLNHHLTLGL